jgi:hypothetical protein
LVTDEGCRANNHVQPTESLKHTSRCVRHCSQVSKVDGKVQMAPMGITKVRGFNKIRRDNH